MFSLHNLNTTMDGNVFPDQEQLLGFLKKLKEVFDVCDENADGFIRVEHLVDLGLQFGQGDEVKKFAKYLDPNAHGRINFKDFCHGVFAIKGCEGILKTALGTPHVDAHTYETDNGYYYQAYQVHCPEAREAEGQARPGQAAVRCGAVRCGAVHCPLTEPTNGQRQQPEPLAEIGLGLSRM
ncbi:hypothetical protein ACEWY4_003256 [Coilia grayii]|uniref:EF-hand domain-containing protein n=1 Tax=Coilia grayii TaxID=363190 RepID=A0ABD1KQR9_9TELE